MSIMCVCVCGNLSDWVNDGAMFWFGVKEALMQDEGAGEQSKE